MSQLGSEDRLHPLSEVPAADSRRLMSVFVGLPMGASLTDMNGYLLEVNPAFCRMLGYHADELRGKRFTEVSHPDDIVPGWTLFQELVAGERPHYHIEKRYLRKDGGIVWARLAVSLLRDDAGWPQGTFSVIEDITEHRQVAEDLARSRDQLEVILRSVDDGITVQDPSGQLVFANAAAARMLGFSSPDHVLQATRNEIKRRFDLVDEHGNPLSIGELPGRLVLAGEDENEMTVRFRVHETGEEHWSIVRATPIRDSKGRVQLAINVFVDITAQKRAEQERTLRLSLAENARSRATFLAEASQALTGSLDYETTLDAVAHLAVPTIADWCVIDIVSEDGSIVRMAAAHADPERERWAQELGRLYPPNELGATAQVIRSGKSALVPEIAPDMLPSMARDQEHLAALRQIGMCSAMTVPLSARGTNFGAISFITAESGRRYTVDDLALAEDLAHRAGLAVDNARLYREMAKVAAERQAILRQMADGVMIVDETGTVTFMNEAARRLIQVEGVGLHFRQLAERLRVSPVDGVPHAPDHLPLAHAMRGVVVVNDEYRAHRPDRTEVIVQVSAAPVFDEDGRLRGAVSAFRDVTAQREMDRQRDQFLSLVSHELRTPITVVRGYLQLLQRRHQNLSPDLQRPIEAMSRQVVQLTSLVEDLLDLSRIEDNRLECDRAVVNYRALVTALIEEMAGLHPGRSIRLEAPPATWVVGDTQRLHQVLVNLIDNALKYGPEGTKVTVTVQEEGHQVVTCVSDEGPPLPEEERPYVFDRLYRTAAASASRVSGLGLGLYISRAIVEAHGGRIWVAGQEHSAFAFSLPQWSDSRQ